MDVAGDTGKHLTALAKKKDVFKILCDELGDEYLRYRERWKIAGERSDYFRVPLQLDIDLTNVCNMACKHCNAVTADDSGPRFDIDVKMLRKRLEEGIPKGIKAINFGNGSEPLTSQNDVFQLISFVKRLGIIDIFLHTNGLLMNADCITKIIDAGVTVLCISLDAYHEDTHRKLGRKGFETVLRNITTFIEKRKDLRSELPILRVSFLPTILNYKEINEFINFWKSHYVLIK